MKRLIIVTLSIVPFLFGSIGINARVGVAFPSIDGESETVMLFGGYIHSSGAPQWLYSELGVEYWSKSETASGITATVWLLSIPATLAVNLNMVRFGIGADIMNVLGAKVSDGATTVSDSESRMFSGFYVFGQFYMPITNKISVTFTPKYNMQTAGDEFTVDINTFSFSLGFSFN